MRGFSKKNNYWIEGQLLSSISKGEIVVDSRVFKHKEGIELKLYPCKVISKGKTQSIDIGLQYLTGELCDTFIMEISAGSTIEGYWTQPEVSILINRYFLNLYNKYSDISILELIEKDRNIIKDFKNRYNVAKSKEHYTIIEDNLYVNIGSGYFATTREKFSYKFNNTFNRIIGSEKLHSISKEHTPKAYVEHVRSINLSRVREARVRSKDPLQPLKGNICNIEFRNEHGTFESIELPVEFHSKYHKWLSKQGNSLDVHLELKNKGFTYRRRGEDSRNEELLEHYAQEVLDSFPSECYSLYNNSGYYYEQILLTDMRESGDYLWIVENSTFFNSINSIELVRFGSRDECEKYFPDNKYILDKIYNVSLYNTYKPHAVILRTDDRSSADILPHSPEAFELYCKWQGLTVDEWLDENRKGYSGELQLSGDILTFKGPIYSLKSDTSYGVVRELDFNSVLSAKIAIDEDSKSLDLSSKDTIFTAKINLSDMDKKVEDAVFMTSDKTIILPKKSYLLYLEWLERK